MPRFLVIGFGNPLRSDDGVGWVVAQELSKDLSNADVKVLAAHQLLPEMAEEISRVERVVFVDAAESGDPGTIAERLIEPASATLDTHELSPAAVLRLAKELYGKVPQAHLLTIAGGSFETGDQLSAGVKSAIAEVSEHVKALLGK